VEHYSLFHRHCVFSHDELACKMATKADDLDYSIAIATYKDLLKMYETEKGKTRKGKLESVNKSNIDEDFVVIGLIWGIPEYRRVVQSLGVTNSERVKFESLPDDDKLCDFCKTTCFLSAITCSCSKDKIVCLKHFDKLCDCPPGFRTLKYAVKKNW